MDEGIEGSTIAGVVRGDPHQSGIVQHARVDDSARDKGQDLATLLIDPLSTDVPQAPVLRSLTHATVAHPKRQARIIQAARGRLLRAKRRDDVVSLQNAAYWAHQRQAVP